MDEPRAERSNALTVDRLIARLDELERAYGALQRAYLELQATPRAPQRPPPVDEVLNGTAVRTPVAGRASEGRGEAFPA